MAQARRDAKPGEIPVVMHRKNRQPWLVTMDIKDWLVMYERNEDEEGSC